MKRVCKIYDAKLKAKVALEALMSQKEILEISAKYNIPRTTILEWKEKLINEATELFVSASDKDKQVKHLQESIETLQKIIGEITIKNSFLKKKLQKSIRI